jgi:hypothetical protein
LFDGAEIMMSLPKALPHPTTHIIDWFHIAMMIQPLQQIADHVVPWRELGTAKWLMSTRRPIVEVEALAWTDRSGARSARGKDERFREAARERQSFSDTHAYFIWRTPC